MHSSKTMEKMINAWLNWYLELKTSYHQHTQASEENAQQTSKSLCLAQKLRTALTEEKQWPRFLLILWVLKILFGVIGWTLKWICNFIIQHFCTTKFENMLSKHKKSEEDYSGKKLQWPTLLMWWLMDLPTQLDKIMDVKSAHLKQVCSFGELKC